MSNNDDKIAIRVKKSKQALKDAELLLESGSFLSTVNRLYYAVFYIVTAYLAIDSFIVKSHKGVKIKFHEELTLKGLISKQESKLFELLHMRRHEFDYDDFVMIDEEEIKDLMESSRSLIDKIENLINKR